MEKVNEFLVKYYNNKGLSFALIIGVIIGFIASFLVGKKKNSKRR